MSSAERLLPQPEVIKELSGESVLIPNPTALKVKAIEGILAESIFLTSKKVRIRATYEGFMDEISPERIDNVRSPFYDYIDTTIFINDRAQELAYADEIVIETFE